MYNELCYLETKYLTNKILQKDRLRKVFFFF